MKNFDDYLHGRKKLTGEFDTDDSKIIVKSTFTKVVIEANKEGLICLAKYLISLAYDEKEEYTDTIHLYRSTYTKETLDENSEELIIKKFE